MAYLSHDEVQRRALRAAAKVALAMSTASVFGACGGAVQSTEPTPNDDPNPAHGTPAESGSATIVIDHPVPDAVVDATSCDVTPDAATPQQLACCSAEVQSAFPPDVSEPPDAGTPSADLVACCAEIVKVYDTPAAGDLGLTFGQARACCYVLPGEWYSHGGAACTPWGPPMPRPMPWANDNDDDVETQVEGERVS
jgi:hypothetical protein